MAEDVPIRCQCGKVQGMAHDLSPATSNHVVCSCKGCQSYAHYLGRTDDMLDAEGGSNIVQLNPATFDITEGLEHVACMSVTPNGPLRWFTSCCNTPLGNGFRRGGIPFLGVLPICLGHKGTSDEVVRLFGPARGHVNPPTPNPFGMRLRNFFMLVRFIVMLMGWRVRGGKSYKPFFDKDTMRPIAKPIKLSAEEQAALEAKAGF